MYISLSRNIAAKHDEIIMITIATYTFCKIAIAVRKAVKQHKNPLFAAFSYPQYQLCRGGSFGFNLAAFYVC